MPLAHRLSFSADSREFVVMSKMLFVATATTTSQIGYFVVSINFPRAQVITKQPYKTPTTTKAIIQARQWAGFKRS